FEERNEIAFCGAESQNSLFGFGNRFDTRLFLKCLGQKDDAPAKALGRKFRRLISRSRPIERGDEANRGHNATGHSPSAPDYLHRALTPSPYPPRPAPPAGPLRYSLA